MPMATRIFVHQQIQTLKGWDKGQLCFDREKWQEEKEDESLKSGYLSAATEADPDGN